MVGAFSLEASNDAIADAGEIVAPGTPPRWHRLAHRAPDRLDLLALAAARLAVGEVNAHGEVQADVELAIAVGGEVPTDGAARE